MTPREKSGALEPTLTKIDKRVLKALAAYPEHWGAAVQWKTAWAVAETLQDEDVAGVRLMLDGLRHFGYVDCRGFGTKREWIRTWRGDEAIA